MKIKPIFLSLFVIFGLLLSGCQKDTQTITEQSLQDLIDQENSVSSDKNFDSENANNSGSSTSTSLEHIEKEIKNIEIPQEDFSDLEI